MTLQSAEIAAYQAANASDATALATLATAQAPNFNALVTALTTGAASLNDAANAAYLTTNVIGLLQQALGNFNTLRSMATAASTNPNPPV